MAGKRSLTLPRNRDRGHGQLELVSVSELNLLPAPQERLTRPGRGCRHGHHPPPPPARLARQAHRWRGASLPVFGLGCVARYTVAATAHVTRPAKIGPTNI